jgi:hypothetical protein
MTARRSAAGGRSGFEHFQSRLGLDGCATLQLGSPFNYREQAELHLFRDMPDPSSDPVAFEDARWRRSRSTSPAAAAGRSYCSRAIRRCRRRRSGCDRG